MLPDERRIQCGHAMIGETLSPAGTRRRWMPGVIISLWLALLAGNAAEIVPTGSEMARKQDGQQVLLSACEPGDTIGKAASKMTDLSVKTADALILPKIGPSALEFSSNARGPESKGDFTLFNGYIGAVRMIGAWVFLPDNPNIATVGIQISDGEGETFAQTVSADWKGWKWLELDLEKNTPQPTPGQSGKNGRFDQPLTTASIVWFAKSPGRTALVVDGMVGLTGASFGAGSTIRCQWTTSTTLEPGQPFTPLVLVTSYSGEPITATLESSVQLDSTLLAGPAPDPDWGTDHARGAKSWTVADGKTIEEGSLTDGNEFTDAQTAYIGNHWAEAFQYIDLGTNRRINHIRHSSGDANWCFKVDISGSTDGTNYTPVPELQGIDWHSKWGPNQDLAVPNPFAARYVRFRYHDDGKKHEVIRMPVAIALYDGLDDEKMEIPSIGPVIAHTTQQVVIPPRSFALVPLATGVTTEPGAYFTAARVSTGKSAQLIQRNVFVMPPATTAGSSSRFGMNAADVSLAEMNQRLGVGWIRFENVKWPFFTTAPGEYAFDGSIAPWHINLDSLIDSYKSRGMNFLPTMFMTPGYLADAKTPTTEPSLYPPKDVSKYQEFTFQTAARYAGVKHPAADLKTADKKSGLGSMNIYELWNEPDLTNADWGSWRGPFEKYLEMFRCGAEGVKQADPKALVSSCGLADYRLETVDRFRTFRYADGKSPLDFIDILNVHHYTGRMAPEIATRDINIDRADDAKKGRHTYEQELQMLAQWRSQYKPGMPIWMSEMGYDTGGPVAIPERTQAAFMVRNMMMALANGIDKVFLFRESGSGANLFWGSGVVRDDHSFKPSWFTYATLIRQLDGFTSAKKLLCADRNIWLYEWQRGGDTVLTAWTVEGAASLALGPGEYSVTDAFGRQSSAPANGSMTLSTFPMYISRIKNLALLDSLHAESRRQEQADRDRLERIAHLTAYLFDFGSLDRVGTVEIGTERRCTPVLAEDKWSPDKGYGFDPVTGKSEVGGGHDPMDDDWVRLGSDARFHFAAKPGRYRMTIKAAPLQADLHVTVTGIKNGPRIVSIESDNSPVEFDIETTGAPVMIQFDKYVLLKWMTVIEKAD